MNENQDIEQTLRSHTAKWHDSCRLQYNKTKLRRAAKRMAACTPPVDSNAPAAKKFTRQSSVQSSVVEKCFLCGVSANVSESLHHVSTLDLNARVRQCTLHLQDQGLLAILSAGELIAQEAKYHARCLASLYNRARQTKESHANEHVGEERDSNSSINEGIALAELVSYIEDARTDRETVPIFKLADLVKMYSARVEQLGTCLSGRVNSTRLKNRILAYFPDIQAHKEGRDVLLISSKDVGPTMKRATEQNTDTNAIHLARAATIVRREIFNRKTCFTGEFDSNCQEKSLPKSLVALVSMVLTSKLSQQWRRSRYRSYCGHGTNNLLLYYVIITNTVYNCNEYFIT